MWDVIQAVTRYRNMVFYEVAYHAYMAFSYSQLRKPTSFVPCYYKDITSSTILCEVWYVLFFTILLLEHETG